MCHAARVKYIPENTYEKGRELIHVLTHALFTSGPDRLKTLQREKIRLRIERRPLSAKITACFFTTAVGISGAKEIRDPTLDIGRS